MQGVASKSFVVDCALSVLIRCRGDDERGDESDDEVQRRGGGEQAAKTNTQVIGPMTT